MKRRRLLVYQKKFSPGLLHQILQSRVALTNNFNLSCFIQLCWQLLLSEKNRGFNLLHKILQSKVGITNNENPPVAATVGAAAGSLCYWFAP